MKRLIAMVAVAVLLLLAACSKDEERFPCESHSGIQVREEVYSGQQPSGLYVCQDGHKEIWESGERTVG